MITTYGVGSLIAVGDRSYVVTGTDRWNVDDRFAVHEPRLQKWLGVDGFRLPPAFDEPAGDGVRIRLFPEMYSCPTCLILQEYRRFGASVGEGKCGDCGGNLVPSRFIVACENGHLDEFPYFQWAHHGTGVERSATTHELRLRTTGRTASLRSIVIECACGAEASLEGAFGKSTMDRLGVNCRGGRPWLGRGNAESGCDAAQRTLQRGASAAWFPLHRSALSIPPWSDSFSKELMARLSLLRPLVSSATDDVIFEAVKGQGLLRGLDMGRDEAVGKIRRFVERADAPEIEDAAGEGPERGLRREEYTQLYEGSGEVRPGDDFECVRPPREPGVAPPRGIERSMLVKRLREVRALKSFTRVTMPDETIDAARFAPLSVEEMPWLPAIEVSGEGVFLSLDRTVLDEWERRAGPVARARAVREAHLGVLRRRREASGEGATDAELRSPVGPRLMLVHTLAHVLINEWSLDAGYPASALRERLYVDDEMAGVLIYTATSDSAGSLGGVVAQGTHRRLVTTLESALERIRWCSQDPTCMESEAGGVDGLNLAACYACVLLPETSCEHNNLFLDRALLIGTPDDPRTGFYPG